MAYDICVYRDIDGSYPFYEWIKKKRIQKNQLAKFNRQIDRLHINGESLRNDPLSDCGRTGLSKFKIHGNVQLRPLLCVVYGDNYHADKTDLCYVFLNGCIEKDNEFIPGNARDVAESFKALMLKDISNRKRLYDRP